jgi:hypothetical protein
LNKVILVSGGAHGLGEAVCRPNGSTCPADSTAIEHADRVELVDLEEAA